MLLLFTNIIPIAVIQVKKGIILIFILSKHNLYMCGTIMNKTTYLLTPPPTDESGFFYGDALTNLLHLCFAHADLFSLTQPIWVDRLDTRLVDALFPYLLWKGSTPTETSPRLFYHACPESETILCDFLHRDQRTLYLDSMSLTPYEELFSIGENLCFYHHEKPLLATYAGQCRCLFYPPTIACQNAMGKIAICTPIEAPAPLDFADLFGFISKELPPEKAAYRILSPSYPESLMDLVHLCFTHADRFTLTIDHPTDTTVLEQLEPYKVYQGIFPHWFGYGRHTQNRFVERIRLFYRVCPETERILCEAIEKTNTTRYFYPSDEAGYDFRTFSDLCFFQNGRLIFGSVFHESFSLLYPPTSAFWKKAVKLVQWKKMDVPGFDLRELVGENLEF